MFIGIDVSRWQGSIDFTKVKASGINGRVDLNQSKNNYPQIMRTHHLNGF